MKGMVVGLIEDLQNIIPGQGQGIRQTTGGCRRLGGQGRELLLKDPEILQPKISQSALFHEAVQMAEEVLGGDIANGTHGFGQFDVLFCSGAPADEVLVVFPGNHGHGRSVGQIRMVGGQGVGDGVG